MIKRIISSFFLVALIYPLKGNIFDELKEGRSDVFSDLLLNDENEELQTGDDFGQDLLRKFRIMSYLGALSKQEYKRIQEGIESLIAREEIDHSNDRARELGLQEVENIISKRSYHDSPYCGKIAYTCGGTNFPCCQNYTIATTGKQYSLCCVLFPRRFYSMYHLGICLPDLPGINCSIP